MIRPFDFELGDKVKETLTGIEGTVMVRSEYWTGCQHYGIETGKLKKDTSEPSDYIWFDGTRLEKIGHNKKISKAVERRVSGPHAHPPTLR